MKLFFVYFDTNIGNKVNQVVFTRSAILKKIVDVIPKARYMLKT